MSTLAASPTAAQPIEPARAASLHRWNVVLTVLHFAQFLIMVWATYLKNPLASAPVVSSYLSFDPVTRTLSGAQRELFDYPIGLAVALFFMLSAVAHFAVAFPFRDWYERHLARGQNPARWIEYSFSSSVMIVVIASLTGIQEIGTLIAIFGANVGMILFGWSMEAANEGRARPQWLHYVFGCIMGIVPWLVIGAAIVTAATAPGAAAIPAFVFIIFISLFISFNVFAINMVLQYGKIGRWRDYLYGERAYMLFSLIAKSLLAWQVFSGTLRP
ncbi:MAG: heliorhodopsin HeR [Chloroflexota bacterium]|nr:heliorhodopsin HeR [Chloroflexota bacterium]